MIRPFFYEGELMRPKVGLGCYIDPSAQVIGDVRFGQNVAVWCCSVLRADEAWPFIIGDHSNIQDGVVLHGLAGLHRTVGGIEASIHIGNSVSLAHGARVHGPTMIGNGTFVGFGTTVHNSIIGNNVYVGHMALVMNVTIGDFKFVPHGAKIMYQKDADELFLITDPQMRDFNLHVVQENQLLRQIYLAMDSMPK